MKPKLYHKEEPKSKQPIQIFFLTIIFMGFILGTNISWEQQEYQETINKVITNMNTPQENTRCLWNDLKCHNFLAGSGLALLGFGIMLMGVDIGLRIGIWFGLLAPLSSLITIAYFIFIIDYYADLNIYLNLYKKIKQKVKK